MKMRLITILFLLLATSPKTFAQFQVNGNAVQNSCNCYTLTNAINSQVGSVWNTNQIDLNNSFDFSFDVWLGCADGGADGMVFGLQSVNTSVGTLGGGMGMQGVAPSIGVFIDTYQNGGSGDPVADHISINANGDVDHLTANNYSGPTSLPNIEDCAWHTLQVVWTAGGNQTMDVYFDGILTNSYTADMITTVFGGSSTVFWGFTAATGGANNEHKFCLELNPLFANSTSGIGCVGSQIQFNDASTSFGAITNWSWDFGDGNTSNLQNPTNTFNATGPHNVNLTITDNSGCTATNTIPINITSITLTPTVTPTLACGNDPVLLEAQVQGGVTSGTSCLYTIDMADSWPDGWNGADIEVFANGVSLGLYGFSSGFTTGANFSSSFLAPDGEQLTFNFISGSYDAECSFDIYDCAGNLVFSDDFPTNGVTYYNNEPLGTVAVPPGYPSICQFSIDMFDDFPDGWNFADIEIFSNGVSMGLYGYSSGFTTGASASSSFTVFDGDPISFSFLGGSWDAECSFDIYDNNGALLFTDDFPTNGVTYYTNEPLGTASCPATPPVYNYLWSPAADLDDATSQTPTANISATTVFSVTADDGLGCTAVEQVTVTISTPPQLTTTETPTCNNPPDGVATVSVTAGSSPYTYLWDAAAANQTTTSATGLAGGNYTVTVTDNFGCENTITSTITSSPSITINSNPPSDASCFGVCDGSLVATAVGGTAPYTFAWSTGGGNAFVTSLCAGNYTLTVTGSTGCFSTQGYTITEPSEISVTAFSVTSSNCGQNDGIASIDNVTGGATTYNYLWDNGEVNSTANALNQGAHFVTLTNPVGGCTQTFTVTITDISGPTVSVTTTQTACFASCDATASAIPTSNGGSAVFTYLWNFGNQTTSTATGLCAGSYTVTITDSNNCSAYSSSNVTQPLSVSVTPTASTNPVCAGQCTNLSANALGGTAPYTFVWDVGAGQNQVVCPITQSFYFVTATDANNCSSPAGVIMINVNPILTSVVFGGNTICDGFPATIGALAFGGNGGPYTYTWNTGATGTPITVNPVSYPNASTYIVTITDGCSAPIADTVVIQFYTTPQPLFSAIEQGGCQPHTTTITAVNSTVNNTTICIWQMEDGTTYSNNCFVPLVHQFNEVGTHDIRLTAVSTDGCSGTFLYPAMISVYELPEANFSSSPNSTTTINTQIHFDDKSYGQINKWDWTFYYLDSLNVLQKANTSNPVVNYPAEPGTYPVNLEVETVHGCTNDTTHYVVIDGELQFYLPNAFTPNGDGLNELFGPEGIGIDTLFNEYSFKIFNRWGNLVFTTSDLNEKWDGKNHIKPTIERCPNDVYVWKIFIRGDETTTFEERELRSYAGHVTLIR